MTNPNHLFRTQGHITKIINDTIVDDSKWNIFSENGKKFKGQLSVLDKKFKFRDINLQDISNIIEKQALKLNQRPSKYSNVKPKYTKRTLASSQNLTLSDSRNNNTNQGVEGLGV